MEDEGQVTGDTEFTEKSPNKAKLASPVHASESHTARPSHCQALRELFQGEWSKFCGVILWFGSALYGRMAVSMQIIYCYLWQRALLSIMVLTYGPNYNTGLPDGQKQTAKSLKKYSFFIFGVYSFYIVTAQRLPEWPSGWLCRWSRASEARSWVWLCSCGT